MKQMGQLRKSRAAGLRRRMAVLSASAALPAVLFSTGLARAQDATWLANPGSGDFNTATNWNTGTVPTGTAFFGASGVTNLSLATLLATVGGWTFNSGASAYTFTNNGVLGLGLGALDFTGAGIVINGGSASIINNAGMGFMNSSTAGSASITNNLGLAFSNTSTAGNATITNTNTGGVDFFNTSTAGSANITNAGTLNFHNGSTAGSVTIINNAGGLLGLSFFDTSTAGNATITNNLNGITNFENSSTAGNATITNNSSAQTNFDNNSTAGNATITNNSGGGGTFFRDSSTAGNATITNNSGAQAEFFDTSTAGNARLINNGAGIFDFSSSTGPAGNNVLSAGSLEGGGVFFLGANQLTVGSNNLSTTVSGVISDCGPGNAVCEQTGATGGSLVKTGTGTLTLTGINAYTGATTVNAGVLDVEGSIATSALATVNANAMLMGGGSVGNTQVNAGGIFMPGNGTPGSSMTVAGNLAFQSGATYLVQLNAATASSANVAARRRWPARCRHRPRPDRFGSIRIIRS